MANIWGIGVRGIVTDEAGHETGVKGYVSPAKEMKFIGHGSPKRPLLRGVSWLVGKNWGGPGPGDTAGWETRMKATLLGLGPNPRQWDIKSTGMMLGVSFGTLRWAGGRNDGCKANSSQRGLCWDTVPFLSHRGLRQNKSAILVLSPFKMSTVCSSGVFIFCINFDFKILY